MFMRETKWAYSLRRHAHSGWSASKLRIITIIILMTLSNYGELDFNYLVMVGIFFKNLDMVEFWLIMEMVNSRTEYWMFKEITFFLFVKSIVINRATRLPVYVLNECCPCNNRAHSMFAVRNTECWPYNNSILWFAMVDDFMCVV